MFDAGEIKCPICGRSSWRTVIRGQDFRIDECRDGCVGRTVPSPGFTDMPVPSLDESIDGSYRVTDMRSGHFRIARNLLDLVAGFQDAGSLLDIGCGLGHLLRLAADRGYTSVGVDASPAAVKFASEVFGVRASVGAFPGCELPSSSFDVVVMNHVIEHLTDPRTVLDEVASALKPGGMLAVAAPNYGSLVRKLRGSMWYGLQPSQHVWQFPIGSIARLVGDVGLTLALARCGSLEYPRGPRSLAKWLRLRIVLSAAGLLHMGDNSIVLARK